MDFDAKPKPLGFWPGRGNGLHANSQGEHAILSIVVDSRPVKSVVGGSKHHTAFGPELEARDTMPLSSRLITVKLPFYAEQDLAHDDRRPRLIRRATKGMTPGCAGDIAEDVGHSHVKGRGYASNGFRHTGSLEADVHRGPLRTSRPRRRNFKISGRAEPHWIVMSLRCMPGH